MEADRQDCRETSTAPADSASRRFPWPSTCDSHDRLPPAKTHQPTVKNGHVKSVHFSARFQEKGSVQGPTLFSSDEEEKEKDAGTTAHPPPSASLATPLTSLASLEGISWGSTPQQRLLRYFPCFPPNNSLWGVWNFPKILKQRILLSSF